MSKKSVHDVIEGIKHFGGGLIVIPQVYQECGISKLVSEIKSLVARLESGEAGLIDVIIRELILPITSRMLLPTRRKVHTLTVV
ncbi:hypothetical protein PPL_09747 [Heterostelium album PN500]|uniref:Uncharacterized protein n=1 Tax=Heterostelium pallidum (strain ATCC 26659 / Pp 5 / PN500) TaxID=670386 RepID=D3BNP4_HETP5|nr:hypothetical protein PPL_09747 [Heterostelium album PN500]EFA76995.1 hypothetical protein PPL_09747 [Heterostelium album PN500]|eukprot:XP_020429126.1 hypothetical protein PPL_09747 [Heterostelium album PN500]